MNKPTIPRSEVVALVGPKRLIEDSRAMSRRRFFAILGWGAFVVGSTIALFHSLSFSFPNATSEAPPLVKLAMPTDYTVGTTTVFITDRVAIKRHPNGVYAFQLIC